MTGSGLVWKSSNTVTARTNWSMPAGPLLAQQILVLAVTGSSDWAKFASNHFMTFPCGLAGSLANKYPSPVEHCGVTFRSVIQASLLGRPASCTGGGTSHCLSDLRFNQCLENQHSNFPDGPSNSWAKRRWTFTWDSAEFQFWLQSLVVDSSQSQGLT